MNTISTILIIIPSVLYLVGSLLQTYVALKRLKEERKDEVWETATRLLSNTECPICADDFAELYRELQFVKDHPEYDGSAPIRKYVRKQNEQQTGINDDRTPGM